MKVIIPVAGIGTRLRPHTLHRPKPLLDVAGMTILDYVLKPFEKIQVEEVVFVVGFMGDQIKEYLKKNYSFNTKYVYQEKLLGLGYALNLALQEIDDSELLIVLGDTIVECDLAKFTSAGDYSLGLRQVEDPNRFGIAEIENDLIVGLEEKPENPKTNLALIGLYYFKDSSFLRQAMKKHVDSGKLTSGEIQFTDALQDMISGGIKFKPYEVKHWYDCGKKETLLATNSHFLEKLDPPEQIEGSVIIPPVYISSSAEIVNSTIGPNVSISDNVTIRDSVLENSIVSEKSVIENSTVKDSLIGRDATIKNSTKILNVGDLEKLDFK